MAQGRFRLEQLWGGGDPQAEQVWGKSRSPVWGTCNSRRLWDSQAEMRNRRLMLGVLSLAGKILV